MPSAYQDRVAMYTAAERAEARLGRPVCSPDQWAHPVEPFILEIKSRPHVAVIDRAACVTGGAV